MSKNKAGNVKGVLLRILHSLTYDVNRKDLNKLDMLRVLLKKVYAAFYVPLIHKRLLRKYQGVLQIRVLFIVSNYASWKVDSVVEAMKVSERFEPIIAIAEMKGTGRGSISKTEKDKLVNHFEKKGFDYIDYFGMEDLEIQDNLNHLSPHVFFITNPHQLVSSCLHGDILKKRLTCYVPYHHEVVDYGDNQEQYNQVSHNAFWRVFSPHSISKSYYKNIRIKGEKGVFVTGLPACEPLLDSDSTFTYPWKGKAGNKLKIIWAPHWLIAPDLKLATIYELGVAIKDLAIRYKDKVEWVMRPHPFLRPALYKHPDWGKEKTDSYFRFWENSGFSQVEEGDYVDLFHTSDAMIHDSGSFLAEYLCLDKPVMYLKTKGTSGSYLNIFGLSALNACEVGRNERDIEGFINALLAGKDINAEERRLFRESELMPLYATPPSIQICELIAADFPCQLNG